MDWKSYVPEDMREKFQQTFVHILTTKHAESLLNDVAFCAEHHRMWDCPEKNTTTECEDCYGDSTERDLREGTTFFYARLWREVFETLNIQPVKQIEEEEAEESDQSE